MARVNCRSGSKCASLGLPQEALEELTKCLDASVCDHAAGEFEEGFVEVVADVPAHGAEAGAVRYAPAGDDGLDAASAEPAAVLVEVVAAVGEQLPGGGGVGGPVRPGSGGGVQQGR